MGTRHVRFHLFLAADHVQLPTKERSFSMGSAAVRSPSIRFTPCPTSLRPRRQAPAYWQRGPTTCSTSAAGSTSPKGRKSCTCRTSPGVTTACSSPIPRTALTSPMSARAPRARRRATTSLRGPGWKGHGAERYDADILAE